MNIDKPKTIDTGKITLFKRFANARYELILSAVEIASLNFINLFLTFAFMLVIYPILFLIYKSTHIDFLSQDIIIVLFNAVLIALYVITGYFSARFLKLPRNIVARYLPLLIPIVLSFINLGIGWYIKSSIINVDFSILVGIVSFILRIFPLFSLFSYFIYGETEIYLIQLTLVYYFAFTFAFIISDLTRKWILNKSLKKPIISIILICSLLTGFITSNQLIKYVNSYYKESEQEKLVNFYKTNNELFNDIKNGLLSYDREYMNIYVVDNGIVFGDGEANTFTENHLNLMENSKKYFDIVKIPQPSISCENKKIVKFAFYYSSNSVMAGIVYTENDVSKEHRYKKIEGNWYYYIYGMT